MMIDKNIILSNKAFAIEQLSNKGYDTSVINELEKVLICSKQKRQELESLRSKRNEIQKNPNVSVEEKRKLRDEISGLEEELSVLEGRAKDMILDVPNFPDLDAPIGASEAENVVVESAEDYHHCCVSKPLPHWEIGKKLDIIDIELATKISGSMFAAYKGLGAKLLRALLWYGLSINEGKYTEMIPPHMVTSKSLTYTGHLPKFADDQYKCKDDDLWLIPTAEVPLTASFANTVISEKDLPVRRMAYTVAFRREAGSAGKDTRGLQRVHEFHKLELLKIVHPDTVKEELADLLNDCLRIIKDLKLQYRVVDLCTGDMGDKYARCYDIEVYAPALGKWLEVSSVGHFSNYQARRANIKFQGKDGKKDFAFTMNGSGMATPRVIAAIIETYQQEDGSVLVPDVLVPFMGCNVIE